MKILMTLLIAIAVAGIGAVGFAYSGFYDVSASSPHSGLVTWLLSTTSHASVERQASYVNVPDLSDAALARVGVNDFDAMCVGCHGAPGINPEAMGRGLNPPAPDLAEAAAHMGPAELFWVTKHGIKMTGMPAWGATHDDDALWPMVAFMTLLPELDADAYQALLTSATGMGHHADSGEGDDHAADDITPAGAGSHDHNAHDHDEPAPEPEEAPHDDGHDHQH